MCSPQEVLERLESSHRRGKPQRGVPQHLNSPTGLVGQVLNDGKCESHRSTFSEHAPEQGLQPPSPATQARQSKAKLCSLGSQNQSSQRSGALESRQQRRGLHLSLSRGFSPANGPSPGVTSALADDLGKVLQLCTWAAGHRPQQICPVSLIAQEPNPAGPKLTIVLRSRCPPATGETLPGQTHTTAAQAKTSFPLWNASLPPPHQGLASRTWNRHSAPPTQL